MSDITDEQIDRVLFQVFNIIDRSEVWGLARQEAPTFRQAVRMALADAFVSKAPVLPGIVGRWVEADDERALVMAVSYCQNTLETGDGFDLLVACTDGTLDSWFVSDRRPLKLVSTESKS